MQIFLKNESDKSIIIQLDSTMLTLIPYLGRSIEIETEETTLTVYADEKYRNEPVTDKLGFSYFHRFVAVAIYDVKLKADAAIRFYKETAHGNNLESYIRIYPFSTDCTFSSPRYTVKDEKLIKDKIFKSEKNEAVVLQGAKIAGRLFKAKNAFDDIITALILGIVALVVFILLCVFTGFLTAAAIYSSVAFAGLLIWKIFLKKALSKAKEKAKRKAENKKDKLFKNCENMPEDLFRGKESYFEHEYIKAVFELSKKRM